MNVVHIITVNTGGAYTAVKRIIECMESNDFHSTVLVRNLIRKDDAENDNRVVFIDTIYRLLKSKAGNLINLLLSSKDIDNDVCTSSVSSVDCINSADVILIHWINSFLSFKELNRVKKATNKPVVIVMHDMWHATGGCHYSIDCERYTNGCVACPKSSLHSRKVMKICIRRKQFFFSTYRPYIITISEWEKKIALSSAICNKNHINNDRIHRIWNPINTDLFKPYENEDIKNRFKIGEKPIILFGADRLNDEVKGTKYIFEAIRALDEEKYNIICFGISKLPDELANKYKYIRCLGRIDDEHELAKIYSMSDVYVTTAVQEAFGYTCCEALACGTPVVAFGVGGMLDQIIHKNTGYLAKPFESTDVAKGIEYCISNSKIMGDKARKNVVGRFDYLTISKQYKEMIKRATEN